MTPPCMALRAIRCYLPRQPRSACPGDGDAFWEEYTDALLPAPEALCLPSCWEAHRLDQLQHPAIADAARAQQVGLRRVLCPCLCWRVARAAWADVTGPRRPGGPWRSLKPAALSTAAALNDCTLMLDLPVVTVM